VTTGVRSGIGLIELLVSRLQWFGALSAYKYGTNYGTDVCQDGFLSRNKGWKSR
jgi:hypothetical protein